MCFCWLIVKFKCLINERPLNEKRTLILPYVSPILFLSSSFPNGFLMPLISLPSISSSVYKPTQNPLRSCISPGLIIRSLQYVKQAFWWTIVTLEFQSSADWIIHVNSFVYRDFSSNRGINASGLLMVFYCWKRSLVCKGMVPGTTHVEFKDFALANLRRVYSTIQWSVKAGFRFRVSK